MKQYISKSAVKAEIERLISNGQTKLKESEECNDYESYVACAERIATCINILSFVDTLEVKEIDLEKEAELIADGIMIGVQANKYHRCVYNTTKCDFNHSHLMLAARKGIEVGLKAAQKGENV